MLLPSLSIVIPTYDGHAHLARCLPAVERHAPRGTQVIVVDDASPQNTAAWVRQTYPWVEVVRLSANGGFCRAVNAGLSQARGDIVELLNDDTEVCAGWAEAALRHFADPHIGSVANLVLHMDAPDVIDSAGQEYHSCGWARNRGYGQRLTPEFLVPCDVFGPLGSAGFYRRSAVERVGGLWSGYGAYFEDTDLAFRLRWSGYRCRYEPASRVLHKGSASYGRQSERLIRLLARNEELAYWCNLSPRQLLMSILPHLGFLSVRACRQAAKGRLGAFLKGKLDALRLGRDVRRRRQELQGLAAEAQRPVELSLARGSHVLQQGWEWMNHRRSA